MNSEHLNQRLSPPEYAARFDAAKKPAVALRAEATEAFWSSHARNAWHSIRRRMQASATHPSQETSSCPR